MEVETRLEKAKLLERISKTFGAAVDPTRDQRRPITIDWDRGGVIGIQIANGNMQRGKTWQDVKDRLKEARIRDQKINDLEFQFNNRKAHTAGRNKGYDIVGRRL
jgi:hypothetical protein